MTKRIDCETLILSDLHLGTRDSKAEEATLFLRAHRCRKLILNGDIVDGWALKSGGKWRRSHTRFIRTVLAWAKHRPGRFNFLYWPISQLGCVRISSVC